MRLRLPETFRRNPFRPIRPRQRLVIVGVTLFTVLMLTLGLMKPHIRYLQHKLSSRHPPLPACAPGQTTGCLGGTQGVMLIPAAPAAAASR